MSVRYEYDVTIEGIPQVPLRTTKEGARILMQAFDDGSRACDILLKAMKGGIGFKNSLVSIKMREPVKKKKKKK